MRESAERYRKLIRECLLARATKLTLDQEAQFTENIEQAWFEMTEEERTEAEEWAKVLPTDIMKL